MSTGLRIAGLLGAILTLADCTHAPSRPPPLSVTPAPTCADFNYPIYFEKGSDELTSQAKLVLASGMKEVRGCTVSKVEVLGLADVDGPANRNLALSRRRAANVAKALEGFGLPAPVFDIEALGETGARAPGGSPEPLRRRTEVVIHVSKPKA